MGKSSAVKVLNLEFSNPEFSEVMNIKGFFVPVNVDMLMKMQKSKEFWEVCRLADYVICDSQILFLSSKILPGLSFKQKISGSDFFPKYCDFHKANDKVKIFLMGAAEGVAATAAEKINAEAGRNIIVDTLSPSFGFEKDEKECSKIIERINSSDATVLAIGVGAPKQEMWVSKYRSQLKNIELFLPIGATIDFEAGNIKRAPAWVSNIGFEWLYRLVLEPKRLWRRYLVEDLPFFKLLLLQLIGKYKNPHG